MLLFHKILSISVISIICASNVFAQNDSILCALPDTCFYNTIKDTIVLKYSRGIVPFETIAREGTKYYAVTSDGHKEEITSFINGQKRIMVKDGDGHELVIDKDGNVMGVEEYRASGGNERLLKTFNAKKDSLMSTTDNITFEKVETENYGFDKWRGEEYDRNQYPTITDNNDYRPAYIGAEKEKTIRIKVNKTKGITFKSERGVPLIANEKDNTIAFNCGTTGRQAIYAYRDSTVVGKVNVQAYSYKDVKVHLVRVNGATKRLDVEAITKGVNEIFDDAVVRYTFDELDPITIEYANKERFVHGGKGTFQNYNEDQKTAIKALPETADQNDYYLFFVECFDRLDTAGNKSKEAVNGYMPVGRHYGFIYNEYTNARTIAHELGHGTNSLHHTFSAESESFYTTKETDNLMDYHGGKYLNHSQWQWAHEKHRNVLGFLDDEGEGEAKTEEDDDIIMRVREFCLNLKYDDGSEKVFDDDLIDNYLAVNGDKYRYRRYIREMKDPISFLTKENITFTQSDQSSGYSYSNQHITIASKGISTSDMSISLFHEYLHRVNHVIGIYRYNYSIINQIVDCKGITKQIPLLNDGNTQTYLTENIDIAKTLYDMFLLGCHNSKYWNYNDATELPTELLAPFLKFCREQSNKSIIVYHTDVVYQPTNYIRDELSVYYWCMEYERALGGMSKPKLKGYYNLISNYKKQYNKFLQYELENKYTEEGYKK